MLKDINWDTLDSLLQSGSKEELTQYLDKHELIIKNNKIFAKNENELPPLIEYLDGQQHSRKISLNASYGSLLQANCRFFDKRLGQSTTLSGRQIVKHMTSKVNEIITSDYDFLGKSIVYGDTDSCYFTAYSTLKDDIDKGVIPWDKETVVQLYDQIGDLVNESFPSFMEKAFHCPSSRGEVIKCGREIVATDALFITKKRYAAMVYDKEGKRKDKDGKPGEIKAMGLDLKRADTPEYMQKFLTQILEKVLTNSEQSVILDMIKEFRINFKERPGWEKGTPKRVNNIGKFMKQEEDKGKVNMPGHVRASINWNILRRLNNDNFSMEITDGAKVIVCKLKSNPMGFTSVAYPIDELRLPEWFKELPFDHDAMEDVIIDSKIDNLIGILKYDIDSTKQNNTFQSLFHFV